MPKAPSLAARIGWLGIGSALLVAALGGWVVRERVHATVDRSVEESLGQRSERVLARFIATADGAIAEDGGPSADEFSQIFSGWYWRLESGGRSLQSRSLWDGLLALEAESPRRGLVTARGPRGEALVGIVRDVQVGGVAARLFVFGAAEATDRELARLDGVIVATQTLLFAALALAISAQLRWGLKPLRALRAALAGVRAGQRERVGAGFGPDLDPVAGEIDEVLARNAEVVRRARHHAADLSHALKKPLALLLARAEAAGPGEAVTLPADAVRREVEAMSRLVDRHLARAGSGAGERRRFALGAPVAALVGLMRSLHQARGLDWQFRVVPDLAWRGEPTDFEEMLGNLLDNAGKWAKSRVVVSVQPAGRGVAVQVDDDGPGLGEAEQAQAVRRGQRFDEATEGSGLGLAIVCDIAETYGGHLELGRSPMGGLRATLTLTD